MEISNNGIEALKDREGFRDTAYKDSGGVWTIGYGTTKINGTPVKEGDTITEPIAEACLLKDCKWAQEAINNLVKVVLNQNQFDALVSFVYNLGSAALQHSTLLRLLNSGLYDAAASEILKWVYVAGKIDKGIINRRQSEFRQFKS